MFRNTTAHELTLVEIHGWEHGCCCVCKTEKEKSVKETWSFNRSRPLSCYNVWGFCLDAKCGCAQSLRLGLFTQNYIQTVARYQSHTRCRLFWPPACWLRCTSVHVHNYSTWAGRRDWGQGQVISACLDLLFLFCIWDTVHWYKLLSRLVKRLSVVVNMTFCTVLPSTNHHYC